MDEPLEAAYLLSQVGAEEEAQRLRAQARGLLDQELALLLPGLPRNARVVDLGCGIGLLADALSQARTDLQVLGVDADALAVQEARRVFGHRSHLSFRAGSLQAGPAEGEELADAVILRLVLMHQADASAALQACRAWLRPGGQLHVLEGDDRAILAEPAGAWLERILALMQTVQLRRGGSRRLGLDLAGLLAQAGWRPAGLSRLDFDLERLGPVFEGVFFPVADFHLKQAVRDSLCEEEEAAFLLDQLRQGCRGGFSRAKVPLFHAWTRSEGP
jgi:SAM-dependent methyltransferase